MRLAIPGVILIGVLLVRSQRWRHEPSQAPRTNVAQSVTPAAAAANLAPSSVPRVAASRPEAEAAALKQEAVSVAGEVAGAYPNDALAYALLGSAHYNTGRSEEAAKYLRKCIELRPDQVDAYEILARVSYEKGELDETARLCREALKRWREQRHKHLDALVRHARQLRVERTLRPYLEVLL